MILVEVNSYNLMMKTLLLVGSVAAGTEYLVWGMNCLKDTIEEQSMKIILVILTGLETPTWSVKWNHSLAIVSNWYIKTIASFRPLLT